MSGRTVLMAGVSAVLLAAGPASLPAAAAPNLPVASASILDRWFGTPGKHRPRHQRRHTTRHGAKSAAKPAGKSATAAAEAPEQSAPSAAQPAVPVPAARPGKNATAASTPADAAAATSSEAPKGGTTPHLPAAAAATAAAAAAGSVAAAPETVPRPQPAPDEGDVPDAAAPAAVEAPAGTSPAAGTASGTASPTTEVADPRDTARKPVTEIPVPEVRPAESPKVSGGPADDPAEPAPAAPSSPAAPPSPAPPAPAAEQAPAAPADDAPNSTEKLKARIPEATPAAAVLAAAAIEDAKTCEAELTRRGVAFTTGESISEGECGVLRPVAITRLSSGVTVSPKTVMLCRAALALDEWMTAGVVPAAKTEFPGETVTEFQHASTYVCRPRASESGISEHARGSAIDIAGFVFSGGRTIGVAAKPAGSPEARFQDAVRAAACGPFKTVLGPGTDADHAEHFHLDIAARHGGATYCK